MSYNHKSPTIPNLKIVSINSVLPHEEHDIQRSQPLMERILAANSWLNPPLVTPIVEDDNAPHPLEQRYAVLDGANRSYSIGALGIPHILVQVVDYYSGDVVLETWNHAVSDITLSKVLEDIFSIKGINHHEVDRETALAALDLGSAIAYLHVLPNTYYILHCKQNDLHHRTRRLRDMVDTYKQHGRLDRVDHDDSEILDNLYPDAKMVVVFPQYQPNDILLCARDGIHLPPGISRHIIQGRAMRLHYPLEALRDTEKSLDEKNTDLKVWIRERIVQKRMRLYEESMYIFDD